MGGLTEKQGREAAQGDDVAAAICQYSRPGPSMPRPAARASQGDSMVFARHRKRLVAAGFGTVLLAPLFAGLGFRTAESAPPGEVTMPTSRRAWSTVENEGVQF